MFSELGRVRVIGPIDTETAAELELLKNRLRQKMERQVKSVMNYLGVYDEVFSQLTVNGNALAFRDFLLKSPEMFLSLGDGCGLVSHIATYWRYQFPRGRAAGRQCDAAHGHPAGLRGQPRRPTPTKARQPRNRGR